MKNKDQEKKDHSKKFAAGTSLLLALALLTTSSLAFRDVDQYKENKFQKSHLDFNVVLVENFEPETNWEAGEKIKKEVHVRNGQDSDPKDEKYEDAYIRLKFSEYMGISKKDYKYADGKYMIDTNGEFVRVSAENGKTPEKAKEELEAWGIDKLDEDGRIVKLTDGFDGKEYYYIKSFESDPHGQWGKKVVTSIGAGEEKPLVETDSQATSKYIPHLWSEESGYTSGYAKESDFSKYVNWELSDDVITLKMWQENFNSRPVKKWILDTSKDNTEGWVYWGEPLVHNNKNASASETSKLLQAVESISFPDGDIAYDLKVEMEAVSLIELIGLSIEDGDGLEENHDWNKEIITTLLAKDELSLKLKELQRLVVLGERTLKSNAALETKTVKALQTEVNGGKAILEKSVVNIELEEVKTQINQLDDAIKAVQSDETIKFYQEYKNAIKFANEKLEKSFSDETLFQGNVEKLKSNVNKWEDTFKDSSEITVENLAKAIDEIKTKYYQIVSNEFELGGQKWRVIGSQTSKSGDFTQAMFVLDEPMKNNLYDTLTSLLTEDNKNKVNKGEEYLMTNSATHFILLQEFYDNVLSKDSNSSNILSVDEEGNVANTGKLTKITSFNKGSLLENEFMEAKINKQAIELSKSDRDLLYYPASENIPDIEQRYWTSLESRRGEYNIILRNGSSTDLNGQATVRPVLWVKVDDNIDLGQEKMPALD